MAKSNVFSTFAQIFTGSNSQTKPNADQEEENNLVNKVDVLDIDNRDGAEVIDASFFMSPTYQTQDSLKEQADLINEYRQLAYFPEVEWAVDDIINAVVSSDSDEAPVQIDLEAVDVSAATKLKITEEFQTILRLLDFDNTAYERFKEWYVDGKLMFQVVVNPARQKEGIQKLIPLDPRAIRKIIQIKKQPNKDRVEVIKSIDRFYIYDQMFATENVPGKLKQTVSSYSRAAQRLRIEEDAIASVTSGLFSADTNSVLSYLEYARKPVNNLRAIEDAMVIYRITRAPEKRAFYIDTGSLPKKSAEEYLVSIMNRFKTKISYDSTSGKVNTNAAQMSMLQDYWLPRREGGRGTEVASIPGGENLNNIDDVNYFLSKLYKALKVPSSRINPEGGILLGGRGAEVSRDEWKFDKFVQRLRRRFSGLFVDLLGKQLVLKGITDLDDWNDVIKPSLKFMYASDGYMKEQQELDTFANRVNLLGTVDVFVGKYFSKETIEREVLRRSDKEIEDERKKIVEELKAGIVNISPPAEEMGGGDPMAMGGDPAPANFGSAALPAAETEFDEIFIPTK